MVPAWHFLCKAAAEETPGLPWPMKSPRKESRQNYNHVNGKVARQDGSVVQYKIKRRRPLLKLMKAYRVGQGLSIRQVGF